MPEIVESDGYSGASLRCFPCFFPAADWFRRVDVINRACRRRQLPMRPGSFLRGGAPLPTSYRQVFLFYEPAERDRIIGFEYRRQLAQLCGSLTGRFPRVSPCFILRSSDLSPRTTLRVLSTSFPSRSILNRHETIYHIADAIREQRIPRPGGVTG